MWRILLPHWYRLCHWSVWGKRTVQLLNMKHLLCLHSDYCEKLAILTIPEEEEPEKGGRGSQSCSRKWLGWFGRLASSSGTPIFSSSGFASGQRAQSTDQSAVWRGSSAAPQGLYSSVASLLESAQGTATAAALGLAQPASPPPSISWPEGLKGGSLSPCQVSQAIAKGSARPVG